DSLLPDAGRYVRDFHAHALPRLGWADAALLAVHGSRVPGEANSVADVHHVRSDHYDCCAVYLRDQSVLEHEEGTEGERQSVGGDDPRVDHGYASAARQLCRPYSAGESRPIRVQRSWGCARLHHANRSGGSNSALAVFIEGHGDFDSHDHD